MGLVDRIVRVIRSQINSLVSKTEDPEKILEQAVMEMQQDLIQVRQGVAQAISTQKRTERQYKQTQSTADEWYKRAQLALQKGDDRLAKEALTRRKSYQETANSLKAQIEGQQDSVDQLKKNMRGLEGKISEAKTKKDLYIARARSAQASEKMSDMLGSLKSSNAISAFERMEEKVFELEARSQAIAPLESDELEKKFSSIESVNVDDELAAMKQQLLGDKPSRGSLPDRDNGTNPECDR